MIEAIVRGFRISGAANMLVLKGLKGITYVILDVLQQDVVLMEGIVVICQDVCVLLR